MLRPCLQRVALTTTLGLCLAAAACEDEGQTTPAPRPPASPPGGAPAPAPASVVTLEAAGGKRAFLSMRTGKLLEVAAPEGSMDWDLSLTGYLLQTNSGPSGPGKGAAYGPLLDELWDDIRDASVVSHSSAWRTDRVVSPFDGWYLYNRCPEGMHTLASRYHVYGVEAGGKRYKLQILSYYALVMGAPVSGRISFRYGEVTAEGSAMLRQVADLDASKEPVYFDLAAGMPVALAEAEAKTSSAWDIAFRRSEVLINGGAAGPKGVRAVDLDAGRMDLEEAVCGMTEASERPRIDRVDAALLGDAKLRWKASELEDAFQQKWFTYDVATHEIGPAEGTWIVRGGDGDSYFKMEVTGIEGASMAEAGKVSLRLAPIPEM
jgi:hypothetical protein